MNKNNKKILIIVIVVILVITSILAVILSLGDNKKPNDITNNTTENPNSPVNPNPNTPDSSDEDVISTNIERLKNAPEFFAIQEAINNFYIVLTNENASEFLGLLENKYVTENNLTESNVLNIIKTTNPLISYQASTIYYNPKSSVTYYFVNGYVVESTIEEGTPKYIKDVNYLVIVTNNKYVIRPLGNVADLETYAKNYNKVKIEINNSTKFSKNNVSNDNKVKGYIINFMDLMFYDVNKAYNMLDDQTKEKYPDLNSFISNREVIADNLFTSFWYTNDNEDSDVFIYKVQNRGGDTITITEYYPNDFKIGFEFLPNRYE